MRLVLPLLLAAGVLVVAGSSLVGRRLAAWRRGAEPTADRVIARIRASGEITATHGRTSSEQVSILPGPVRLRGTRVEPNKAHLQRLFAGLAAFAKPHEPDFWHSIDVRLEIEVDETATTAWLSWLIAMAQQPQVGMTRVALRRMPSGRLIQLDLPQLGEWEGPRPSDKEEPRTVIKLRRGRLPPRDDRQVIKVMPFHHYVGDEIEIPIDGQYPTPQPRLVADLPSIDAWRTTAGRRVLAKRLRHVCKLIAEDLACLDSVKLDVIVQPLYTRYADMPAYVVLDVLEGLRALPAIRLQYDAMVEGWW